jgi:hypothetical protein
MVKEQKKRASCPYCEKIFLINIKGDLHKKDVSIASVLYTVDCCERDVIIYIDKNGSIRGVEEIHEKMSNKKTQTFSDLANLTNDIKKGKIIEKDGKKIIVLK